jgi:hypothetical protein
MCSFWDLHALVTGMAYRQSSRLSDYDDMTYIQKMQLVLEKNLYSIKLTEIRPLDDMDR